MPHKRCKTSKSRRLHLEVGYLHTIIREVFYLLIQFRVLQWQTKLTSLWSEESSTSNRNTTYHIISCNSIKQLFISTSHVWISQLRIPFNLLLKLRFKLKVRSLIATCIKVQQTIKTNTLSRRNVSTNRSVRLQSSTSTDSYECQLTQLLILCTCLEIDISKRI